MYGYTFNLPIFLSDMGEIDCIFRLNAASVAGFITCAWIARLWFKANQHEQLKQLSRSDCIAICQLRAVQRIELKLFKATTIEVANAKRDMSKTWDGSQVLCTTHSSLWADLAIIMMDRVADLSSSSAELDFSTGHQTLSLSSQVKLWRHPYMFTLLKCCLTVKSIPSTESVFSCVKRNDKFLYHCRLVRELFFPRYLVSIFTVVSFALLISAIL